MHRAEWIQILLIGLTFIGSAHSQTAGHVHEMAMEDQTDPEQLPRPSRMKGIGNSALRITANHEAQRWFNQGLNQIHDFWDYESARSFQESIRSDRQCAMCYWGLYKALSFFHGNNQGYGAVALAKAMELRSKATERERLYIEATASATGTGFENGVRLWRELVRRYPDDEQAKIFLSSYVPHSEAVELLHSVLKKKPNDSAANHYLIHALESTDRATEALGSALILPRLAPHSGHMVHMPGHIYFVLGQYESAEKSFASSAHVDESYMQHENVKPDDDWNYVHNMMYSIANFMEEGKLKHAEALSSRKLPAARGQLESTLYIYQPRDSMSRIDPELPVALRTADWAKIRTVLSQKSNSEQLPNLAFLSRELLNFANAMQAFKHRDWGESNRLQRDFEAELSAARLQAKQVSKDPSAEGKPQRQVSPDALLSPLIGTLSVMSIELRAWSEALSGKLNEAALSFDEAAAAEKSLGYREPPAYVRPVRESEGEAFLQMKDWSRAQQAYIAALKQRPASGFALYGIALSAEKAKQFELASQMYGELLRVWRHSDRGLAQIVHAKAFLAQRAAA